jgi:serine/threonine-protein kinase RsbW
MSAEYEICVSSRLTNLAEIAEFVSERAVLAGLDENQVFDVQVALDEACTNIIEHAYEGDDDGELRICCFVEGDDFVIRIQDSGKPFCLEDVPLPDTSLPIEEREIGGLGVFLMRQMTDAIEYKTDPETGNELILRKRRKAVEL